MSTPLQNRVGAGPEEPADVPRSESAEQHAEGANATSEAAEVAVAEQPAAASSEKEVRGNARGEPWNTWSSALQSLTTTVVIAVFVITFIVQAFQIPSGSMEDTLFIGDYLLVDKVHYGDGGFLPFVLPYKKIYRRDIVVFRYPIHPEQHFVKRVIGVPGDHVRLRHGTVYVNGVAQREPYVVHKLNNYDPYRDDFPTGRYVNPNVEARWFVQMHKLIDDSGELIVPEDSYFVLGDNRDDSLDSRYWGFVPRESIVGRPLMIYFSVAQRDSEGQVPEDTSVTFASAVRRMGALVRWDRCLRLVR